MIALFHGLIGTADHWQRLRAGLPPGLRLTCFAPDIDYAAMGFDAHIAEFRREILSRRPDRLVLCGNSIGCVVALRLTDLADEVVMAAPPFAYDRAPLPLQRSDLAGWVETLVHRPDDLPDREAHLATAVGKLAHLTGSRAGLKAIRRLKAECEAWSDDSRLAEFQDRITHVLGAEDFTTPVPEFTRFHERVTPAARLLVLPDAAHTIPIEAPLALAKLLSDLHGVDTPLTHPPSPLPETERLA